MPPSREHEDVELGELEHDTFLPNENASKQNTRTPHFLARHLPQRIRDFLENLSRIKIAILLLVVFVLLLGWVTFANRNIKVEIPEESVELSQKVATELADTAIPDFVLTYAPLVFISKNDIYFPSDMATHIVNTHPTLNFTAVEATPKPLNLDNLNKLNDLGGEDIFLSSKENLVKYPKFLRGKKPNRYSLATHGAKSCVVIVVEKEEGIIDAFYMYFYTFNEGPTALGYTVGNHLGDWEHNMIRFKDGLPTAVWYSQHEYGEAYSYDAVQKAKKRPIGFSAMGSHANYAVVAAHDLHDYDKRVPSRIVYDHTSAGKLWDPTLSAYFYTYSPTSKTFTPAVDKTPVNYLYFNGRWGDQQFASDYKGQESFHGFYKWTSGPQGPWFKHLDRKEVCLPSEKRECVIKERL